MSEPESETTFKREDESSGYASPRADMIAAALLIILASWYTFEALGFRAPGGWKAGAGLVPAAAGISLLVMALGLAYSTWRRRNSEPVSAADDEKSVEDPRRMLLLTAMIFVYLLAMGNLSFGLRGYVGDTYMVFGAFEISTVLCLCAVMRVFWDGALWKIVAISVGWTTFLSITFRNVFLIFLPD
ncbi:MAG: tripartite tricarboxylate transporter TctB family protein [Proteobacteria bacterium]|nr:tripartite tricarboxylate transporter TctB family protein [Pseudomonadota bacterium]